ncbi:hypothetical protein LINGRAHAP2_LOCUS5011, partial [Linum grandiflorum]
SRQWEVHPSHIYREANNTADYLTNLGHSLSYVLHLFDSLDRGLSHWLHYDLIGVSLPRFVRISNNNYGASAPVFTKNNNNRRWLLPHPTLRDVV